MKDSLPTPPPEAIFYENDRLYACLASYPITKGHCVVVWKDKVVDLHLLSRTDYEYLMDVVDEIRNKLLEVLKLEKIYLIYMDEVKQVHWHLVPRYDSQGFNMLTHVPTETKDFSLASTLRSKMIM
ncbi:MAG: HIT domain-containing protein [Patescibacteria group bacterium]